MVATSIRRTVPMILATAGVVLSCSIKVPSGPPVVPTAAPSEAATATPGTAPSPIGHPQSVEGLHVYSVSELLSERNAGALEGGPIALWGFWSERTFRHSCVPAKQTGDLELRCADGEWGITEFNEPIGTLTPDNRWSPAVGPHLTPFITNDMANELFHPVVINGQRELPAPIVVVGHLDDERARLCQPAFARLCADRFVLDRIVDYHPELVPAPAVSAPPTPFPFDAPPPPPFDAALCVGPGPYSFVGWISREDLGLDRQDVPATAYVVIAQDVREIGGWIDDPMGSGQRYHVMGRPMCVADEFDNRVGTFWLPGSEYLEWQDGHRSRWSPPPAP